MVFILQICARQGKACMVHNICRVAMRLAARALLRAAPTSRRSVHNFGTRCATPSGDSALFYHVVFVHLFCTILHPCRYPKSAAEIRQNFAHYFCSAVYRSSELAIYSQSHIQCIHYYSGFEFHHYIDLIVKYIYI